MVRAEPGRRSGDQEKKLIEAGEHWVTKSRPAEDDTDDLEKDLEFYNFSAEDKDRILNRRPAEPPDFVVHEDNWPAVEIFLLCQTQWRTDMGVMLGLDYKAVTDVIGLFHQKRKRRQQILQEVNVIEHAALKAYRKEMSK